LGGNNSSLLIYISLSLPKQTDTAWDGQHQRAVEKAGVPESRLYASARDSAQMIPTITHWTQILPLESEQYVSSLFGSIEEERRKCMPSGVQIITAADILSETSSLLKDHSVPCVHSQTRENVLEGSKLILGLKRMQEEFGEGISPEVGTMTPQEKQSESPVVGEGCFGKVITGSYGGEEVAVKVVRIPEYTKNSRSADIDRELLANLSCELSVLKQFGESHRNLVMLFVTSLMLFVTSLSHCLSSLRYISFRCTSRVRLQQEVIC
jgi:hypothetical protein